MTLTRLACLLLALLLPCQAVARNFTVNSAADKAGQEAR